MAHHVHGLRWNTRRDRPRVLVEATEWSHREALTTLLRGEGYDALSCPGPSGSDERCHLALGACSAAEGADVIVHTLCTSDLRDREALQAIRQRLPSVPVIVEVPRPVAEREPETFEGCIVVHPPLRRDALLEALTRALAS